MDGTMTTATSANDYRERGWSTIPLKIRSKEPKLPKGHPFLRRKPTEEEFDQFDFRHNLAIVTGQVSRLVVLDDDDAGETLRKNGWHVPPTPTVKTRRGHQYYMRCPEDGFPTFDVVPEHLEVRADGAYVVAPPSIHPSGERYEWVISPDEAELSDPPDWIFQAAATAKTNGAHNGRIDMAAVLEGVREGERDKTLFRTSASLRGAGVPYAFARKLVLEAAANCTPPFPEREAIKKLDSAYRRYEPNKNGHSRSHSLGREGMGNDPVRSIRAVSFRGRENPGPREWIVEDAVCKGHPASWYGESGIAKSLLAAHMGLHIAADGIDYWAGLRVQTVPVIYADFELDEDEHLRRAKDLSAGMGLLDVPAKFHYLGLAGVPASEAFQIAAEECDRLNAGLVIVDSVGFALDGDAELAKDVLRFYRECVQPIRKAGATPHLIDHQAKVIKGEKYSDKQEFGSVYKTNAVRSSFQIRGGWDGNELTATFTHKKTNFGPKVPVFSLKLLFGVGRIRVDKLSDAVADPDHEPSKKEAVLATIIEMGRATAEEVAQKTGINTKTVQNAISEHLSEGALADTGEKRGRSRIVIPVPVLPRERESGMAEQEERIRQLVREGMSETLAREEVLGKGWVEP